MNKLQRAIDIALAVVLVATIFTFAVMTLAPNAESLYNAATRKTRLMGFMENPGDPSFFDMLSARIASLEDRLNALMWKKDELGYINSSFQYLLGKDMITTGKSNMVTLNNGGLYDIQEYIDLSRRTDEIVDFANAQTAPVLFMYEHPTIYGGGMLTGGYLTLDRGDEMSDEIVAAVREGGVEVMDSRDILTGGDYSSLILRTDQHWTPLAALDMTRALAGRIGLDAAPLSADKFELVTYERKFLGKYGQRIGVFNIEPDDYTLVLPTYPTFITRDTVYNGEETHAEGDFRDSVIKMEYMDGDGWNITAYQTYGLREDTEHFHNPDAPEFTVIVFKDSYSSPVGAFLSLVARDVYLVDMRSCPEPAQHYVDACDPDYIVIAYSRQMLCDNEYDLFEGY